MVRTRDRVATVCYGTSRSNRDATVTRSKTRRHAEIKRCVQWHTPLTIAKAAASCVEAVSSASATCVVGNKRLEWKKKQLVTIDDPGAGHANASTPSHLSRLSVNFANFSLCSMLPFFFFRFILRKLGKLFRRYKCIMHEYK